MKKYRIGLEFSEKKLQLAVVAKQKEGWQLLETFAIDLTLNNKQQVLQEARRSIARSIRHTIISVPYHQVMMKEIRVDNTLNSQEIYQHLQQQATSLLGKSANHWYLDFEPQVFSTQITQQACFRVVAAPRENILAAVQYCRELGFYVHTVTVDVLALAHITPTLQNYRSDQVQAMVWLRSYELLFMVTLSGQLIFSKTTTYQTRQSIPETLTALIHFFNGLYPQHILENIFLLADEPLSLSMENIVIENAALNTGLWQVPHTIQSQELCSLGLAIYGD